MSYSFSFTNVDVEEFTEKVNAFKDSYPQFQAGQYASEEMQVAFEKAVDALLDIMESGCVGDISKHRFSGSISGHSNPNHTPEGGWSQDALTVSISQVRNVTPAWAKAA